MNEILEKLKENAGKTKDSALKIGKQVIHKANNAVSNTKFNIAIGETEGKIKNIYEEIGKVIYENHLSNNSVNEFLEECYEKLDKLYAEISAIKEKAAELKDYVKCSECGAYNDAESVYCSKCGMPMAEKNEPEEVCDKEEGTAAVKKVITIKARKPKE